jgi:micrococcal nuclease
MLKPINAMQTGAKAPGFFLQHLKIVKVVDGDGIWVREIFSKKEFEIRLLGIDAPEVKRCRKLFQDERETHLPGQLLLELGRMSWRHLQNLAPIGETITLQTEGRSPLDPYGRTLGYVFLSDQTCLNERMIGDGFAKPYDLYFCSRLPEYQISSIKARVEGRGLFSRANNF